ncbi:hypothetical protein [Azohydromonas lata]|uniref:hypothetical protein n=1 Tax=Azohydromonas lata TaxID=45677 RepID=UPI0008335DCF|nr:hypothetical protein [Azohydromonas lata]
MADLTIEHLRILQHTTGMDEHGRFGPYGQYRNHFVAGADDETTCRELVTLGYMTERDMGTLSGGMPCFNATRAGIRAAQDESPPPPKLTRGQRRYRAWLAADSGLKFGEWLRDGGGVHG